MEISIALGLTVLMNCMSDSAGVDGDRLNVVNHFESKNDSKTLHERQ